VRIATDIGGTFTDLAYVDDGQLGLAKASSTPPNFDVGVLAALDKASGIDPARVVSFVHGSTLVINALTERSGVTTALLTTSGFRDILDIGRANRPDLYNLMYVKPTPMVPRHLRYEVRERMDYNGAVLTPLEEDDVLRAVEEATGKGARAIAVCFLHSYANPAHELRAAEVIKSAHPELVVTTSHDVTMEWREYERTSTAVLNAYVQPIVADYIERLEGGLASKGIAGKRFIMQSSGGSMSFRRACESPITMVESGPVGGVTGAAVIGKLIGIPDVVTMDIGGTTAKTSLIRDGEVPVTTDYRIERTPTWPGYPIKVPVVDIVEIGAGGGSIAGFDEAGKLMVGPKSAGAVPGPACYPEGGKLPTVTDANLIVGRINPEFFLGGEIPVSPERARQAMTLIGEPLSMSAEEAALGVIRLANANMVSAIKLVSVRRGHDPRDFALVAFGGGGSMHASELARALRIGQVVIPPAPGHFSAWGMLMTDVRRDWVRTRLLRPAEVNPDVLNGIWDELERTAGEYLTEEGAEGGDQRLTRSVELRYKGQEHTVKVAMPGGRLEEQDLDEVAGAFNAAHQRQYTFSLDTSIEYVTFHLTAFSTVANPEIPRLERRTGGGAEGALKGTRAVHFDHAGVHETPIYDRLRLLADDAIEGPAVIEEPAASTVVFPDQRVTVDEWGNLIIHTEAS
jgi:N-methylhydantoinase A